MSKPSPVEGGNWYQSRKTPEWVQVAKRPHWESMWGTDWSWMGMLAEKWEERLLHTAGVA